MFNQNTLSLKVHVSFKPPREHNGISFMKVTHIQDSRGIFHPLGKAVTRGGWDFIKKQPLKIVSQHYTESGLVDNIAYGNGVEFDFGNIYPESSVITGDYKYNQNHWTKQFI